MALADALIFDRIKPSPALESDNTRAALIAIGASAVLAATIGNAFFQLDQITAGVTAGSGTLVFASGATSADGPLYILGLALIAATTISMVKAFKEGRFYVKVDLAELARLGWDMYNKTNAPIH